MTECLKSWLGDMPMSMGLFVNRRAHSSNNRQSISNSFTSQNNTVNAWSLYIGRRKVSYGLSEGGRS